MNNRIIISAVVNGDRKLVWDCYTKTEHITQWNFADPSWHCPKAENDMTVGGKYLARMEAKDGSFGFDFEAVYTRIEMGNGYSYVFGDRSCDVSFTDVDDQTKIIVSFDPETEHPIEMQEAGWQAILNNFKKYVESI